MAGKPGRSGGARIGAGRKPSPNRSERAPAQPRVGACSVYVVHEVEDPSVCKIGVAFNVAQRFSTLQVGTWRTLRIAATVRLASESEAHAVERQAHLALAPFHCRGEWFRVSPSRAIEAVNTAASQLAEAFADADAAMRGLLESANA